jgi:endonuclease V-like protein UPF0215 family
LPPTKPHPRVFAFDDAPFTFESPRTAVVGLIVSLPSYIEGVVRGEVEVDGTDATRVLRELIAGSGAAEATQAVLLDGISFGGFNVVDLDELHSATGLPVITVTRRKPDLDAMEAALRQHFPEKTEALRLLRAHPLFRFPQDPQPLWLSAVGATQGEAIQLLRKSLVRGSFPEPLRLAHLVASVIPPGPISRSRA